jgi:hypothetical protein
VGLNDIVLVLSKLGYNIFGRMGYELNTEGVNSESE